MFLKRIAAIATATLLLALLGTSASAAVVNFDDLTGTGVLDNYAGITWSNWTYYSSPDNLPAHSGTNKVGRTAQKATYFSFAQPVQFQGAYFSSSYLQIGTSLVYADIAYSLYNASGSLVYSSPSYTTLSPTMTWFGCPYTGLVKKVEIRDVPTRMNPRWVMDDMTYQSVPEPSSLMALTAGMGSLAAFIRRRRA